MAFVLGNVLAFAYPGQLTKSQAYRRDRAGRAQTSLTVRVGSNTSPGVTGGAAPSESRQSGPIALQRGRSQRSYRALWANLPVAAQFIGRRSFFGVTAVILTANSDS